MIAPAIKRVAKNGQISLPPAFRGKNIILKEEGQRIIIEPLYWDNDLGVFLTPEEYEDIGDTEWRAKDDGHEGGVPIENIAFTLPKSA